MLFRDKKKKNTASSPGWKSIVGVIKIYFGEIKSKKGKDAYSSVVTSDRCDTGATVRVRLYPVSRARFSCDSGRNRRRPDALPLPVPRPQQRLGSGVTLSSRVTGGWQWFEGGRGRCGCPEPGTRAGWLAGCGLPANEMERACDSLAGTLAARVETYTWGARGQYPPVGRHFGNRLVAWRSWVRACTSSERAAATPSSKKRVSRALPERTCRAPSAPLSTYTARTTDPPARNATHPPPPTVFDRLTHFAGQRLRVVVVAPSPSSRPPTAPFYGYHDRRPSSGRGRTHPVRRRPSRMDHQDQRTWPYNDHGIGGEYGFFTAIAVRLRPIPPYPRERVEKCIRYKGTVILYGTISFQKKISCVSHVTTPDESKILFTDLKIIVSPPSHQEFGAHDDRAQQWLHDAYKKKKYDQLLHWNYYGYIWCILFIWYIILLCDNTFVDYRKCNIMSI